MAFNNRSIYYTTFPENKTEIDANGIINLINMLKGFDFVCINNHYAFIYNNLNIIISNSGGVQLSLISTRKLSQDLASLARLAIKINSIIGINQYSKKKLQHDDTTMPHESIVFLIITQQNGNALYNSPLISGLMGLFGVLIAFYLNELKELSQYEYFLLSRINDLLKVTDVNIVQIDKFYNKLHFDLRAQKLKSFKTMVSASLKAKNHDDYSSEKEEIKSLLNHLKKGGPISRIKSKLKV